MSVRLAHLAAFLAIAGFGLWLYRWDPAPGEARGEVPDAAALAATGRAALAAPGNPRDTANASAVPCAVPITWRIAAVDPRFGLAMARARAAVEEAAAVWERAAGVALFPHRIDGAMAVRFIYDERQAETERRRQLHADLEREGERLTAWRDELAARDAELVRIQAELDRDAAAFRRRLDDFNARVRRWNEQGGAPEPIFLELRGEEYRLNYENQELTNRNDELLRRRDSLHAETELFNRAVEDHARRVEAFESSAPPRVVESGQYHEVALVEGGRVVGMNREIRIYRFDDWDQLVLLIAHELGHALGIGHVDTDGAVMHEFHARVGPGGGAPDLHPADLRAARALCPDLFPG